MNVGCPSVVLSQTLDLQILGQSEEGVEVVLRYGDLAMVHEVQGGHQVGVADATQVNERVLVDFLPEDGFEEVAAG